jgi:hypothetical protein
MAVMVIELVAAELDGLHERVAGRFGRAEPRARVREYVSGLVAGLERKNGWSLANGRVRPARMACSGCCAARTGTSTGSAMMSGIT